MNIVKLIIVLCICAVCQHAWSADTYCEAKGGTHHSILSFSGTTLSASQNKAGQTISKQVDNGGQYEGVCHCNRDYNYVYFTAKDNPALRKSVSRNKVQYYVLDEYLDVGLSIMIMGRGYINVPFEDRPNNPSGYYNCVNSLNTTTFTSGSDATIYFYVKEPFIGTVTIPLTLLASLYANTSSVLATDYGNKLADVFIQGDITAPQECEVNGCQIIEVDFGKISASSFSSVAGTGLSDKKIPIKASVRCTGMSSGQDVEVSLHATQAGAFSTMIETTNQDVGIKVYDEFNQEVDVNGGRMETDMGTRSRLGVETGEFNFSAAPASATGARPEPGTFTATATITMEIKN
ncbi:fimbrial protein [Enterobacter hormaechei]|uniref:fimbrial protein n=1 Tax=Enterobacter hormaechei TaxID=158836 RepID=UPI0034DDA80F